MLPKHMSTTCLLPLSILLSVPSFSQKRPNPKIGKSEAEISSFILTDYYYAFGGQLVYRLPVTNTLKIGGGALYGANSYDLESKFDGYGAVFADAMQFLGQREKWSFGGQIGHGIYNDDYGLKAGIYYSLSCNYRAIVSKRLLFTTSLVIGYRDLHHDSYSGTMRDVNTGFTGLRFGVVL